MEKQLPNPPENPNEEYIDMDVTNEGVPDEIPVLGEIPEEFLEGIRDMEAYGDYQYVAGSNMEITYKAYDTKLDCDVIVKRVRFPTKKQQILHCAKLDLNI